MADVLANGHMLVIWNETAIAPTGLGNTFGQIDDAADPDTNLGAGSPLIAAGAVLCQITPDSGFGVTPDYPEPIENRIQGELQYSTKSMPGRQGGTVDFRVEALAGENETTTTVESGGPYVTLIRAAYGAERTHSSIGVDTVASSADRESFVMTQNLTAADATNLFGCLISVENTGTAPAPFVVRQILSATSGASSTITTCSDIQSAGDGEFDVGAGDTVRPIKTWAPAANPTGHDSLYVKRRATLSGVVEGSALDFAGVGLTMTFEAPRIGGPAYFHFTGQADAWRDDPQSGPENPLIGTLLASFDQTPPLVLGSRLFLDTARTSNTAYQCAAFSVDSGVRLSERSATSGANGRAGWNHLCTDPVWQVTVPYDEDLWFPAWTSSTLYRAMLLVGENSLGDNDDGAAATADEDKNYFVHVMPAAQVTKVVEVNRDGLVYMELTLVGRRSDRAGETLGNEGLYPYYFGVAGKV